MKNNFYYADTVDEILALAQLPLHAYPTVECAIRNIELPLNEADYNWVTSNEINLFGIDNFLGNLSRQTMTYGRNMSQPTLQVANPVVITGVCVYAYGEPFSTVVEGNNFGPRSAVQGLDNLPASPINLRDSQKDALIPGAEKTFDSESLTTLCPSQLDWGGPTWRFIWAFLNAFRLRMECPHSSYENLINERLVDIGNCCSLVDFSGLSDARAPHNYITRRINARLAGIDLPTSMATFDGASAVTDPGYFVPINCEQNADGEISPNRMTAVEAAYGRPAAMPAVEAWYSLPFPMPLDPNTKIKMILEKASGDEAYETRMLDEGLMRQCEGPIPALPSGRFPIDEDAHDADPDGGYAGYTTIPGGQMRLGLGLKGFEVREGACLQWRRAIANKALLNQLMSGQYDADAPLAGTGLCGAPGVDNGEKIIDEVLSKGRIENVPVDGGSVGE